MVAPRRRDGGARPRHTDGGDGARGRELQPPGAEPEAERARAGDRRRVSVPEASELLWVLLVGAGDAGGVGERGVFGGVRGGAVEVL